MYYQRPFPPPQQPLYLSPPLHFHHHPAPLPRTNFHVPTQVIQQQQQQYRYHIQRQHLQQRQARNVYRNTSNTSSDSRTYRQQNTRPMSDTGAIKVPNSTPKSGLNGDPSKPPFSAIGIIKLTTSWIAKTFCFCSSDDNSHIIQDINYTECTLKKEV